ncbi:nuclear transport factor 2 family protein [Williamsia deligens]|nr:nuclear transport factor 2 family protein [Williamsia deligens]MCP2193760.1 steroid delta-isomerase [Williamsia deligens]
MTAEVSVDRITEAVHNYVEYLAAGDAEKVVGLFADGATVEDPIGSDIRSTRESLLEFYGGVCAMSPSTELRWAKVAGDTAVFEFVLHTRAGDNTFTVTPVDIMRFDEDGRVVSMRAVWDPEKDIAVS